MVEEKEIHPLEVFFGMEEGSIVITEEKEVSGELVPIVDAEGYDDKDKEIEGQFQEVYNASLMTFNSLTERIEHIEPKYRARVAEVASTYLGTALAAAKEKMVMKQGKDKTIIKEGGTKTINNNLIVADRNEILRAFLEGRKEETRIIDPDVPPI